MKKALRKDFYMEVRKTYNRFLSIFLIVAIGVAFFSGVRASKPDMELSADRFFDENHYMDIRVLSTLGLTDEDVAALREVEGVENVVPSYSMDVLTYREDGMYTLKVLSLTEQINEITVLEGRLPETSGECILDSGLKELGYRIGDVIVIQSGTDDDISDSFHTIRYTVVGFGSSPAYISLERESSKIGRGFVDGFIVVPKEDFALEAYTEIYISAEGARELVSYRDDYQELVDGVVDNIEGIRSEREEARYQSVKSEAGDRITEAEQELEDGKAEAETELADAYQKIQDAKREIADGKQEIANAKNKLADAKQEIAEQKKKLKEAQSELENGKAELAQGKADYAAAEKQLDDSRKEIEAGKEELEAGITEFEAKKAELLAGKDELKTQKQNLAKQEEEFLQAKEAGLLDDATVIATEQQLEDAKDRIAAYETELEEGEKELKTAEAELEAAKKEIAAGEKKWKEGENELANAAKKLEKSEKEIEAGQQAIDEGWAEIAKAEEELEKGESELYTREQELLSGEEELVEKEATYWDEKAKSDSKIADAEKELSDAKRELADLKMPEWYVLSREQSQVYAEYGQNAERIGAIGEVFPVFFFLIAALVCLTTMTRMVEEERTQIGTLKALGYSKASIASKYLMYAGIASLGGGIFGALVGQKIFPAVIVNAYRMMYINLPYCLLPYNTWYSVSAIAVVMACTVFAAYFACAKELKTNAAELMRPEAPKNGKRVLLERVGFIWNHLSFGQKASVRNLFRYKKRFFMTIIGIGGCMALMLVGFGIRDSIYDIARFQYEELFCYTGAILKNDGATAAELDELYDFLDNHGNVERYMPVYQTSVDLSAGKTEKSAYLICPENVDEFENYIQLRDRMSKETYQLSEDMEGVVLTEKMASMLGVEAGDEITVKLDETTGTKAKILYVTENYAMHYVYVTPKLYEKMFAQEPEYNMLFYRAYDNSEEARNEFAEEVLGFEAASEVQSNKERKSSIDDMLGTLDIVVWVLIISAGLLAFIVLYNLNNININERRRELATLRVLGFYHGEVGAYVYRESVMLTVIGIIVGAFMGIALHRYVILTVEVDMLMFGRTINWKSYLYGGVLTALFSVLINWVMYFKLKKIDMVESLKSIE